MATLCLAGGPQKLPSQVHLLLLHLAPCCIILAARQHWRVNHSFSVVDCRLLLRLHAMFVSVNHADGHDCKQC